MQVEIVAVISNNHVVEGHGQMTLTQGAVGGFPRGKIENLYLQETTTILRGSCATFPWSFKGIIEHKGSHKGNAHHNHLKGNYNCFSSLCSCS